MNAMKRKLRILPMVTVIAAVVIFLSLSAGAENRARVRTNATAGGVTVGWFGSGGGVCYGQARHQPGFGGALGITDAWSCLCYYTQISSTGGSFAQSPSCTSPSSVYTSGTPKNSWHLGCVGVFNCGGSFVARH
jgi:hypothetical protein